MTRSTKTSELKSLQFVSLIMRYITCNRISNSQTLAVVTFVDEYCIEQDHI